MSLRNLRYLEWSKAVCPTKTIFLDHEMFWTRWIMGIVVIKPQQVHFQKTMSLPGLSKSRCRLIWSASSLICNSKWTTTIQKKKRLFFLVVSPVRNQDENLASRAIRCQLRHTGFVESEDDPLSAHSAYKTRTQGSYTSPGHGNNWEEWRMWPLGSLPVYMESKMMALETGLISYRANLDTVSTFALVNSNSEQFSQCHKGMVSFRNPALTLVTGFYTCNLNWCARQSQLNEKNSPWEGAWNSRKRVVCPSSGCFPACNHWSTMLASNQYMNRSGRRIVPKKAEVWWIWVN